MHSPHKHTPPGDSSDLAELFISWEKKRNWGKTVEERTQSNSKRWMRDENKTPMVLLALSACAVVSFNTQYWAVKSTPGTHEHRVCSFVFRLALYKHCRCSCAGVFLGFCLFMNLKLRISTPYWYFHTSTNYHKSFWRQIFHLLYHSFFMEMKSADPINFAK